ncbi:MAG: MFS transporter [Bacteroidetes bacterium]|nr:MFS transporter [Bacteroidota bacterium]
MQKQDSSKGNNIILFIVMITSFINPFLGAAVNIALPKIAESFQMDAITMSWIGMCFLLASAVFLVPMGKIADIIGRKRIFLTGNIILTLGSILCALSTSTFILLFARFVQGVGSSMVFGTGMAIVTSAFPPQNRGRAIGITVSSVYFGLSVAPLLGGILTHYFGWRSIFYVTVPLGVLVVISTLIFIKEEWADAKGEKFDFAGSAVYMIFMSILMYGFTQLPEPFAIGLTIIGLSGMIWFVKLELRTQFPVLNIHLFKNNKVFAFSNLAALINYAATFAITFLLSLYLQFVKGFTPRDAGMLLVTQPLLMTVFASLSGRLSDRFSPNILSSFGMGVIVIGLILLTFINESTQNTYLIVCLVILGIGFGLFSSPNTNSIMSSVEKKYLGIASATVSTMRLTGQMFSMGIATLIMNLYIGHAKITILNRIQFLNSVQLAFIFFAVLCTLGVFASLARNK